eukprot:IDg13044t1
MHSEIRTEKRSSVGLVDEDVSKAWRNLLSLSSGECYEEFAIRLSTTPTNSSQAGRCVVLPSEKKENVPHATSTQQ